MSLLRHAPHFTMAEAVTLARDLYGLHADAQRLPSERDQNFLLTIGNNERYVLKVANSLESRELLEAQHEALRHLKARVSFCPEVILARSGESIVQLETHYARIVTFIPGEPLAKVAQTPPLLFDLGASVGRFTQALSGFDNVAFHRDFHWDLARGLHVVREYSGLIPEASLRDQVNRFAGEFESEFGPGLATLPHSVIHGDANDYNVIVEHERVVGLIDFGDMVYSYTAGELAIALAYVVLDKPDRMSCVRQVVGGYLSVASLTDVELRLLWPLTLMRLCMSVCLAAYQQQQSPENEYLDISQRSIRNSLPQLLSLDPKVVSIPSRSSGWV